MPTSQRAIEGRYVCLQDTEALIRERLPDRTGHFMNPSVLDSQFEAPEPPEHAIRIEIGPTPGELANEIVAKPGLRSRSRYPGVPNGKNMKIHILTFIAYVYLCSIPLQAQLSVPSVRGVTPLGVGAGQAATLEIRGADLDGATALRFDDLDAKIEGFEPSKDLVKVKLRLPSGIAPGPRSFRVVTPRGVSNAGLLVVGRPIPTVAEAGPNHGFRKAQVVTAPATIAGGLKDGNEVDVFAVEMKGGQTLVAESVAARAGSGLDALVTIFSPEGRELASDDDLFGRDGAAWITVPALGRYFVQIADANGRHRDGAIEGRTSREYLLTIGEVPLLVSAFPPGGRWGGGTRIDLLGVNLPDGLEYWFNPPADTPPGDRPLRVTAPKGEANALNVRVGDGPEYVEPDPEPADDPLRPAIVAVPGAINGRFAAIDDGEIDFYRLVPAPGREGHYAITVYAARLGSSADPVVAVVDPRGISQAEDDDSLGRDARIERTIDPEGLVIAVRDSFRRGGPRFVYRIEVEPTHPRKITAVADLGGRTIPRAGSIAVPITLVRQDDDGPATILAGKLPPGVSASPVTIAAKAKGGLLVLTASIDAPLGAFPFRLAVRDVRGAAEVSYRERGRRRGAPRTGPDGKPEAADGPVEAEVPVLAVAEPAPLGLSLDPADFTIAPGGQVDLRVALDRRSDPAKKPVKLRLIAGDGDLDGLEKVDEVTVPPDKTEHVFRIKVRANASPRRATLTVKGWFEGSQDTQGVDARAAMMNLAEKPR